MPMQALFDAFSDSGHVWLKGNTHTHTTCSDGVRSPEEAAQWYRKAGYDFLFLTEHEDKLASPQALPDFAGLSTNDFLVLPGLELRLQMPDDRSMHVVALGVTRTGVWRPTWNMRDAIRFTLDEGGVPIIAHPYWSGMAHEHIADAYGAAAIEVFNTTTEVVSGKGFARSYWDDLLRRGVPIHGVAADDTHWCWELPDYGKGWIMIKAERLSRDSILEALRTGRFYASCGPEFMDVSRDGNEIVVCTSPVQNINFITDNGHSSVAHATDGQLLSSARRDLSSCPKFLRIECIDTEGRFAWTNAVML